MNTVASSAAKRPPTAASKELSLLSGAPVTTGGFVNFKIMKTQLKNEIFRVTKALYSERVKFEKIHRFVLFGRLKSQLVTNLAVRVAARLEEPLKREDLDMAFYDLTLALKNQKDETLFRKIVDESRNVANLLWMKSTLEILKRSACHQRDEYSFLGMIYTLEKTNKGPISRDRREWAKSKYDKMAPLSEEIERLELEALEKEDPEEYLRHIKEVAAWKLRTQIDTPESLESEKELAEVISDHESEFSRLIQGDVTGLYER